MLRPFAILSRLLIDDQFSSRSSFTDRFRFVLFLSRKRLSAVDFEHCVWCMTERVNFARLPMVLRSTQMHEGGQYRTVLSARPSAWSWVHIRTRYRPIIDCYSLQCAPWSNIRSVALCQLDALTYVLLTWQCRTSRGTLGCCFRSVTFRFSCFANITMRLFVIRGLVIDEVRRSCDESATNSWDTKNSPKFAHKLVL